jgi:uncharacterized protein YacL
MYSCGDFKDFCCNISKTIIYYSTPSTPAVSTVAFLVGFWTGRIVYTYAPGIISKIIIKRTIHRVGNVYVGHVIGLLFTAPAAVPTFTPYLVAASAIVASYAVIIISNLFLRCVYGSCCV